MCALFISLYVAESYFKCMNILIGDLSKSHNMWVESERKYDSTRVFFFCNLLVGFFSSFIIDISLLFWSTFFHNEN